MAGLEPDFLTRFVFNDTVIVELSSDYEVSVMVEVYNVNDEEWHQHRTFHIEADEIDVFIAALNLYKNRLLNPGGRRKNE